MQTFEEVNSKSDKIFIMLERHEASLIVDALELVSKHFPKKKKLQTLSSDISNSFPYQKSELYGLELPPLTKKKK